MADIKKTIDIVFGAVDNVSAGTQKIGNGLSDVASRAQALTGPLASVASGVMKFDAAMTALAVTVAVYATSKAIDLESAMFDLQKVMKDSDGKATDSMETFAKLGKVYGVSTTEIVKSTAGFAQSGKNIRDSLSATDASLKLAAVGDMDLATASKALGQAMAGLGEDVSYSSKILDAWNELSNNSGITVKQLGEGMSIISPLVKNAGYSFEETNAQLAILTEVSGSASESANALKSVYSSFAKPTKEVTDLLKKYGITLKDNSGNLKSVKTLTDQFLKSQAGLTKEQKLSNAATIAGTEQGGRFITLIDNQSKIAKYTAVQMSALGSANKEFGVVTQKTQFQVDSFGAAIDNLAAKVGTKYLGETKQLLVANNSLFDSFMKISDGPNFTKIMGLVKEFTSGAAEEINKLAKNLPAAFEMVNVDGFIASLKELGDTLGKAFDIDLGDPKQLAEVMQTVIDSLTSVIKVSEGMVVSFSKAWEEISKGIKSFNNLDDATKKSTGETLGFAKVLDTALGAVRGLGDGLSAVGYGVGLLGVSGLVKQILSLSGAAGAGSSSLGGLIGKLGALGTGAVAAGGKMLTLINPANYSFASMSSALTNLITKIGGLGAAMGPAGVLAGAAVVGGGIGIALYQSSETVRNATDHIRDSLMDMAGYTNDAKLKNDLLAESYENMLPSIQRYQQATNDYSGTQAEQVQKTLDWIDVKRKEMAATEAAASAKEAENELFIEALDNYLDSTEAEDKLTTAKKEGVKASDANTEATKKNTDSNAKNADSVNNLSRQTELLKGVKITDIFAELNKTLADSTNYITALANQFGGVGNRMTTLTAQLIENAGKNSEINKVLLEQLDKEADYRERIMDMEEESADARKAYNDVISSTSEGIGTLTQNEVEYLKQADGVKKAVNDKTEGLSKQAEQGSKTTEAVNGVNESFNKLKSTSNADMTGGLKKIASTSETAKAAIEGLASSFTSTGTSATGLVDAFLKLSQSGSSFDKNTILDQLQDENKRRDDTLAAQLEISKATQKQIEAETKLLLIKAQKLQSGDLATINIKTDGLEPALQSVLESIVKYAQVRANAEGGDQLLGIA